LLSGCAGLSSIPNGFKQTAHPSATASSPTTTLIRFVVSGPSEASVSPGTSIAAGTLIGTIGGATANVSCPDRGRTVSIQGSSSGHTYSLIIEHIAKGASLAFPPINGPFSTSVTLKVALSNSPGLVSFYAGPQTGGAITGNGSMKAWSTGQSGSLNLELSSVAEIDGVLLGADLSGTWRCP